MPIVYKEVLTNIHTNLSALLKVTDSSESVKVERFRELSQESYLLILENFPWVSVCNTLHKFLAHVYQFIEINSNTGLCNLSEEGLEQGHELIREFSTHLSRKSDFLQGLEDIATRLYIYGCPVLNDKFREIISRSVCGEVGLQKNCQHKGSEAEAPNQNEEIGVQYSIDQLVNFITEKSL